MTQLSVALQTLGMEAGIVDLWDAFITEALDLLWAARDRLFDPPQWQSFIAKRDDPSTKSGTGTFGKARRSKPLKGHRVPDEVALSQEMCNEMRALYGADEGNRWPFLWRRNVMVSTNEPALHGHARGKNAKLVDLIIVAPKVGGPSFTVEAKVVIGSKDVTSNLLGGEGLDCFTRENPYTKDPIGGLLAYTVEQDHNYWLAQIGAGYGEMPTRCISSMPVQVGPPGAAVHLAKVGRPGLTDKRGQLLGPIIMVNLVAMFGTIPPAFG